VFPAQVTNNPNLTMHVVGEIAAVQLAGRAGVATPARRHERVVLVKR
jgi:hypothetical protein